ncbi:MAG: DUF1007 family protein [Sulfurimonadaceae bacterium]|nr:DUF1007 family protein [Sulfurimonadaceae bacterium]
MRTIFTLLLLSLFSLKLLAHPHVFVDTSFNIVLSDDASPVVEVTWKLDDMASMTMMMDYDLNGDGSFDAGEAAFFKKEEFDSLADRSYFTYLHADGKAVPVAAPTDFHVSIEANAIVYRFTVRPLSKPDDFSELKVACYDPENYMAMFISEGDSTVDTSMKLSQQIVMEEMDNFVADILLLKVDS